MANMIPDVRFPAQQWTSLYAATGLAAGTPLLLVNKLLQFDILLWEGPSPPAVVNDGVPLPYGQAFRTQSGASNIWAYFPSTTQGAMARMSVQEWQA